MPYRNPILRGTYPDPSICRVGEDYYLVTSSFCYFPGVPIFHSRDLVHWRQIGHCLTRPSQLQLKGIGFSLGIFAPTLRYHDGRFYMVTTLVAGGGHFYVWTDDPAGEWSDPSWLEQDGIDPSLFFDDDGKVYLTSTGEPSGIYQAEFDLKTGKPLSEKRLIWKGMGGRYPEGPHLYKVGSTYYLMISEGGTEYAHRVTMARANSVWGDFEPCPFNPIFTHQNLPSHPLQATGHADLVQDHTGNWWMVCLAIRPNLQYFPAHHLGRETILVPVAWNADGWLVVNGGQPAELENPIDPLPVHRWPDTLTRDDFATPSLNLYWNFIRTPEVPFWSTTERPGWLRLIGQPATLNEIANPAFVGRRQQYFASTIQALIDFDPQREGEEAGLTLFQNEDHHYEIGIRREMDERVIFVRQRIGSLEAIVARAVLPAGTVILTIETTLSEYTFGYQLADGIFNVLTTGRTRYLTSEIAGGFTGVFVGMYATGHGAVSTTPADFDWFEIQPHED